MPGYLVNSVSMVKCAHGGMAQPTTVFPKVLVKGSPVVLATGPYQIAGCAMPPPPGGNGPCVTAQFTAPSTKVFAGGVPILVQSSQGICAPTGTPALIALTQTFVFGI